MYYIFLILALKMYVLKLFIISVNFGTSNKFQIITTVVFC